MTKRFDHVEMTGDSVRLRPCEAADAEAAYALLEDSVVTRTLLWDGPSDADELAASYALRRQWWKEGTGEYTFAIDALESGAVIGSLGLHLPDGPQEASVGYWLGQPFWGRGFATEAVRLALHFAYRHAGAARVIAIVFTGNPASRRVLEKNGFHLEATLAGTRPKRGELLDEWRFSLSKSEWEERDGLYRPTSEVIVPVR